MPNRFDDLKYDNDSLNAVIDAMMLITPIKNRAGRQAVLERLPLDLYGKLTLTDQLKIDAVNILGVCASALGGILDLFISIRFYAGDDQDFENFLVVLQKYMPAGPCMTWKDLLALRVACAAALQPSSGPERISNIRKWFRESCALPDTALDGNIWSSVLNGALTDLCDAPLYQNRAPLVSFVDRLVAQSGSTAGLSGLADNLFEGYRKVYPAVERGSSADSGPSAGGSGELAIVVVINPNPQHPERFDLQVYTWPPDSSFPQAIIAEKPQRMNEIKDWLTKNLYRQFIAEMPATYDKLRVEFVLPLEQLGLDVDRWPLYVEDEPEPVPLGEYVPVVVRPPLSAPANRRTYRAERWKRLTAPSPGQWIHSMETWEKIKSSLSDLEACNVAWLGVSFPSSTYVSVLRSCVQFGVPLIVWPRDPIDNPALRELLEKRLPLADPGRVVRIVWQIRKDYMGFLQKNPDLNGLPIRLNECLSLMLDYPDRRLDSSPLKL